jgi:hypothetical protein
VAIVPPVAVGEGWADGAVDPGATDGSDEAGRALGPTPAATWPGDGSLPTGSAGAAINGAPTHAPTTTTVATRAISVRRSPRFMSGDGAT